MTEFTKGPWVKNKKVTSTYIDINNDKEEWICQVLVSDISTANANLIAAAPDMYELLDNIRILCEWGHNEIDLADEMLMKLNEIKDQLKKARGE